MDIDQLRKSFSQRYKEARDRNDAEVVEALKLGYDLGLEEAYWDWRATVLSWETKHELPPVLTDYLQHLRDK